MRKNGNYNRGGTWISSNVCNYQGKLMKRNTLEKKFNSKSKENLCIQEKHDRTKVRLTSDFQTTALNANDQRFLTEKFMD